MEDEHPFLSDETDSSAQYDSEKYEKKKMIEKKKQSANPLHCLIIDEDRMGTQEDNDMWMVRDDLAGIILSTVAWFIILYAQYTITAIVVTGGYAWPNIIFYSILTILTLWSHVKTMITDPGAVTSDAMPLIEPEDGIMFTCGRCNSFKPPTSHHCRISQRCIVRMDHHCPWMNNAIGALNLKHFFLFLFYSLMLATYCLLIIFYHLIICDTDSSDCKDYTTTELNLIRVLVFFAILSWLFSASMIVNQVYAVVTGLGTIDRMKIKKGIEVSREPVPWKHIFGSGPKWLWLFPVDPEYEDIEEVMGFSSDILRAKYPNFKKT